MSSKPDINEETLSNGIENINISSPDTQETVLSETIDPQLLSKWPKVRLNKVPTIFLHKPENIYKHIENILKQNVSIYPVENQSLYTKIKCPTMNDHKQIVNYMNMKKLHYHTYGNPLKTKMKVVIRGLPPNIDLNQLKKELKSVSIPVIRVHIMHRKYASNSKILVLAVVPHDEEGKTILKLKKVLGYEVKLEPPVAKPKQCYRCQKWGHSQRYCRGQLKCVKCAGNHNHKKCFKIGKPHPPKCANCGENHTANYKYCKMSPYTPAYKLAMDEKKKKNHNRISEKPPVLNIHSIKKMGIKLPRVVDE